MDKRDLPSELLDNFRNNQAAFFVGAGLSVDAGYPTWDGLILELIKQAKGIPWINKEKIEEYEKLIDDSSKFLFLAEELKLELGAHYIRYMEERFLYKTYKPTKNHELLAKIECSLMLTVNY